MPGKPAMHVVFWSGKQFLTSKKQCRLLTLFYEPVVSTLNTALFYFTFPLQGNRKTEVAVSL